MTFIPFRIKILSAFTLLLAAVLGASLFIVNRNQTRDIQSGIREQLTVTRGVFLSLIERWDSQLRTALLLLGSDHAFKEAISLWDPKTIESAARNFQSRIGSDAIWVTDDEGVVYADTSGWKKSGDSLEDLSLIADVLENEEPGSGIVILNGVPYQLVAVPILAPDLIGVLMTGFGITDALAQELKEITFSDLSFVADGKVLSSTLGPEERRRLSGYHARASSEEIAVYGEEGGRQIILWAKIPGTDVVTVGIQRSWDEALVPLKDLRRLLIGVGLAGLLMTALVGLVIAGGVTASMTKLVLATRRLADGELEVQVDIRQRDEIGQLGSAFNSMVAGLREKEKIRSVLKKAVSKEIAEELLKSGEINLGGEERTITMLFADIRGFTTISESLTPQELVTELNGYFMLMGKAIEKHRGVIDKYIGDAIMALFGAPLKSPEDATNAQRSALGMLDALEKFNADRRDKGLALWDIGIGLNTGKAVAGNLGSENRSSYTAIGDAVNLASRLEGLTKHYGVKIIVSGSVREATEGDSFLYRSLDLVRVKGKTKPVEVFELLGEGKPHSDWLDDFEAGVAAYRGRDFEGAEKRFKTVLENWPKDKPAKIYLERVGSLKNGVPDDWDPAHTMTEK